MWMNAFNRRTSVCLRKIPIEYSETVAFNENNRLKWKLASTFPRFMWNTPTHKNCQLISIRLVTKRQQFDTLFDCFSIFSQNQNFRSLCGPAFVPFPLRGKISMFIDHLYTSILIEIKMLFCLRKFASFPLNKWCAFIPNWIRNINSKYGKRGHNHRKKNKIKINKRGKIFVTGTTTKRTIWKDFNSKSKIKRRKNGKRKEKDMN